jgi:hypothetical protein
VCRSKVSIGVQNVRYFLACSPRTGNNWVRQLVADSLYLTSYAVHRVGDVPWDNLPPHCIVSLHEHASAELYRFLARHDFKVVVMVRHPLDVLISILHYAQHEPKTALWLAGEGGDESGLAGAGPLDPAFLTYACGARAAALLGISAEWLPYASVTVRYEELCKDSILKLRQLLASLGVTPARPLDKVTAENTLTALRKKNPHDVYHFWRGQPGFWRRVLTLDVAREIWSRHRALFETLGYSCDPDPRLTAEQARLNWSEDDLPPAHMHPIAASKAGPDARRSGE